LADKSFNRIIVLIVFGTIAGIAFTIWSASIKSDIENFDERVSAIFEKSNRRADHKANSPFAFRVDSRYELACCSAGIQITFKTYK
jgi:hypothetical protein